MNSQLTEEFVACFARLPDAVKAQARKSYRLWRDNPSHPSLHFKRIHGHEAAKFRPGALVPAEVIQELPRLDVTRTQKVKDCLP